MFTEQLPGAGHGHTQRFGHLLLRTGPYVSDGKTTAQRGPGRAQSPTGGSAPLPLLSIALSPWGAPLHMLGRLLSVGGRERWPVTKPSFDRGLCSVFVLAAAFAGDLACGWVVFKGRTLSLGSISQVSLGLNASKGHPAQIQPLDFCTQPGRWLRGRGRSPGLCEGEGLGNVWDQWGSPNADERSYLETSILETDHPSSVLNLILAFREGS